MSRDRNTSVYVGNLPADFRNRDLEQLFEKYGRIKFVDIKSRPARGPPFAFVEYEDARDAEDAVRGRDGYDVDGSRLRVELTRGSGPRGPGGRPTFGGDRSFRDFGGRGGSGRRGYKVFVTGLPTSGSWQDLKDHMRDIGDVLFADVSRNGDGVVEFAKEEDAKYAVKKMDDTKFKSHEGESSYIRLRMDDRSRSRSRSRSPRGGDRRRSPSPRGERRRSPGSRSRSPLSRSRSPSPKRARSASRSRSRSP
ncbi:Rsp-3 [Aphelenchoides fujianensis]|nr:Rsp-3 [Aphelenchoides fujianensis]